MGRLHCLKENAYGITGLFHLSNVDVIAGFIVTVQIIHIEAGLTLLAENIFQYNQAN